MMVHALAEKKISPCSSVESALKQVLHAEPGIAWAYQVEEAGGAGRPPGQRVSLAVMPFSDALHSLRDLAALGFRVSAQFFPRLSVDVANLRTSRLAVVGDVLRGGRVLIDRVPTARRAWEAYALSLWFDIG